MAFIVKIVSFAVLLLSAPRLADAADVTINSFICNQKLNVYATDFSINCGGDGCTMGDVVNYAGTLVFSDVMSKDAYITLSLKKYGLGKEIYYHGDKVNLCARVSSANGQCYDDGQYSFYSQDLLPTLGDKDWFLTGTNFNAQLDIYSDSGLSNLIGTCRANIDAVVTQGANRFFNPPSATRTGLIFLGVVGAFSLLTTCMCLWMDQQEKKQKQLQEDEKEQHDFAMIDAESNNGAAEVL